MDKLHADSKWYKGHDKDQRIKTLEASLHIFQDLTKILEGELVSNREQLESRELFKDPNWTERTAYELGVIQGLKKAIKYLPYKDNKD